MPHRRIIFPLDVPDIHRAGELVQRIGPAIGVFKVGLQLFTAEGPSALTVARRGGQEVFLDLKLHDIPATVANAVTEAARHQVKFLTVHAAGGKAMLEAAAKAVEEAPWTPKIQLLAVTALTSLGEEDLQRMKVATTVRGWVRELATLAWEAGIRGFVCSPLEVAMLRAEFPEATLVVPGIRLASSASNDQVRIATPTTAMKAGADYLVIGRPIRDADSPIKAAQAIADEIRPFVS